MEHRPLGTSGLEITRLGFGAWSIGGAGDRLRGPPGPFPLRLRQRGATWAWVRLRWRQRSATDNGRRQRTRPPFSGQYDQHLILRDDLAFLDSDVLDLSRTRRNHRDLHLHRFEDDQLLILR